MEAHKNQLCKVLAQEVKIERAPCMTKIQARQKNAH